VVAEVEPEPEPVVAEVEPEPEPVVAEVEPEPEAVEPSSPPRIAPISETILHFPSRSAPEPPASEPGTERVAAEADSPELAARRAQLDMLGLGDPGEGSVSDRPAVLPYRSRGATPTPAELAALARGGFWEASAREVAGAAANVGVQNCGQCGLSLSATARFCRRCGTRQAQPA
jgi:ribosomal protein L40E